MKQSPMLKFPMQEYRTRLEKVVAQMARDGLDALILTSDDNTFFFS